MRRHAPSAHESANLDRIDHAILDVLRRDGRVTYQRLSELVNLTPRPCLERVRKLEKMGVIAGYGALIDMRRVAPCLTLFVQVALSNQSGRAAQTAFEAALASAPWVLDVYLVSGQFDYLIRMECRDMHHYRELTETWLDDARFHIDKIASSPELAALKQTLAF
ncbi:Lrp/AsnC family transcriptional regulator [Paraburkholderia sp. Ac-20347]|jgi:Lrp/AsnC family transcriptional regulator, leucine-responsive regulatory protein|uniref:Lrp/AsnC family transcriptional regulator n=1 Tax=Paraburkholderia sp. Ac-20347 TaxID=2703892 RepID=UPI001981C17F|nr:Lrp/AsnC family transcriptional regulator [Paraburkholderia sp. Ac-20347]MBN3811483.1 Lrp/AsnC family transcriptional regulator [Paraburkholderia sp. Ac-20347]